MAVYSVLQVVTYLNEVLGSDSLLQDLWVRGEVANLARPGSGHSYFSLREGNASLRGVMFRSAFGAEMLSEGSAVIAHGHLSVYDVRGDLQLIVDIVRPEGVGELQLKLDQLRLKLEAEGLFERSRKRLIPALPRQVGVVTSPTGAVWHDVQRVIERRFPLVELVLAPTAVQGEDAAPGIVSAFDALNDMRNLDVVLLARGGGSLEDLWPFNEEAVARAIFASRAPVISGVGHETDVTIADLVADRRAPTPSAAAEIAVPDRTELAARLVASQQTFSSSVTNGIRSRQRALSHARLRLDRTRPDLDGLRMRMDDQLRSLVAHLGRGLRFKSERSSALRMRLGSLSPRDTLRRGYAIVQPKKDPSAVVSDAADLQKSDQVQVTLAHGGFGAEVTSTHSDDAPQLEHTRSE